MLGHGGGQDGSVLVADEGLGAAGSDVDAEKISHCGDLREFG